MRRLLWSAALAAALGAGCATSRIPTERFVEARAAVRAAEEIGATETTNAALHLKLAREQLARAQALADAGETEKAELELMRAHADADLALALAREAPLEAEAAQLMEKARELPGDTGGSGR